MTDGDPSPLIENFVTVQAVRLYKLNFNRSKQRLLYSSNWPMWICHTFRRDSCLIFDLYRRGCKKKKRTYARISWKVFYNSDRIVSPRSQWFSHGESCHRSSFAWWPTVRLRFESISSQVRHLRRVGNVTVIADDWRMGTLFIIE